MPDARYPQIPFLSALVSSGVKEERDKDGNIIRYKPKSSFFDKLIGGGQNTVRAEELNDRLYSEELSNRTQERDYKKAAELAEMKARLDRNLIEMEGRQNNTTEQLRGQQARETAQVKGAEDRKTAKKNDKSELAKTQELAKMKWYADQGILPGDLTPKMRKAYEDKLDMRFEAATLEQSTELEKAKELNRLMKSETGLLALTNSVMAGFDKDIVSNDKTRAETATEASIQMKNRAEAANAGTVVGQDSSFMQVDEQGNTRSTMPGTRGLPADGFNPATPAAPPTSTTVDDGGVIPRSGNAIDRARAAVEKGRQDMGKSLGLPEKGPGPSEALQKATADGAAAISESQGAKRAVGAKMQQADVLKPIMDALLQPTQQQQVVNAPPTRQQISGLNTGLIPGMLQASPTANAQRAGSNQWPPTGLDPAIENVLMYLRNGVK